MIIRRGKKKAFLEIIRKPGGYGCFFIMHKSSLGGKTKHDKQIYTQIVTQTQA